MRRKSLVAGIRELDQRLGRRHGQFARQLDAARARVRGVHAGWWLGGGVVAGYVTGRLGAVASLRYARAGLVLVLRLRAGLTSGWADGETGRLKV